MLAKFQILFVALLCYSYFKWAGDAQKSLGFFYCSKFDTSCIGGVVPPFIRCNDVCAHLNVDSNGTGDAVFCCHKLNAIHMNTSENSENIFAPLVNYYDQNTQQVICDHLHNIIWEITQMREVDLTFDLKCDINCIHLLYLFFKSPHVGKLLKS